MKGRPPKSTEILEISGAFEKNPKRALTRGQEPTIKLGPPPRHWRVAGDDPNFARYGRLKQIWRETVRLLPGLPGCSRFLLEDLCVLRYRARFETLKPSELNQLRLLGNSLGLDGRERYADVQQAKRAGKVIDPRDAFEKQRAPSGQSPA